MPWTEDPGGLQSNGSQRIGHDWVSLSLLLSYSVFFLLIATCPCFGFPQLWINTRASFNLQNPLLNTLVSRISEKLPRGVSGSPAQLGDVCTAGCPLGMEQGYPSSREWDLVGRAWILNGVGMASDNTHPPKCIPVFVFSPLIQFQRWLLLT